MVPARQPAGIQDRENVAFDEATGVASLAAEAPQKDIKGRQRAHPVEQLDERAPHRARHVHPYHSRPPQRHHPTRHRESHEHEVRDDDDIGD